MIKLKGDVLFSMIEWKAGQEEFQSFLRSLLNEYTHKNITCLLYTSDAADERSSVDLGGRRIIKKKNREEKEDEKDKAIIQHNNNIINIRTHNYQLMSENTNK